MGRRVSTDFLDIQGLVDTSIGQGMVAFALYVQKHNLDIRNMPEAEVYAIISGHEKEIYAEVMADAHAIIASMKPS